MTHRILFACLALLAACGGRSPSPSPGPLPVPSVQPANPIVGLGTHSLDLRSLEELRALGITHTRTTLYAALWELDGAYREEFAAGLRRAAGFAMRVLVVVHQVPEEWSARRFADWMGARAEEIGYTFEAVQIGNEAWSRPGSLSPADYAEYFNLASLAIKAEAPHALVVTMALPNEAHARALFGTIQPDAFALHVYGPPLADRARQVRAWLPVSARVWMTEFGVDLATIGGDEARQLEEWRTLIEGAHGYERVFGYQLRTGWPEEHGIINADGTPRQAALWLGGRTN